MKSKNFIFGILTLVSTIIILLFLFLLIDLHYHKKYMYKWGLNYKGYRGKVVAKKEKNELRIVMLGGSTVFGYGVKYNETLSAYLEQELQKYFKSIGSDKKVSVINLGYNSEGVYAYYFNLIDFYYLNYDYVIIYTGYNDLGIGNTMVYRHSNFIFRYFGYMPIFPYLAREKIAAIQSNYYKKKYKSDNERINFGNRNMRVTATDISRKLVIYNNLDEIIKRLRTIKDLDFNIDNLKTDKWSWVKFYMKKSIDFLLSKNKKIIIINQPYLNNDHIEQEKSLSNFFKKEYGTNNNFYYLNLGNVMNLNSELVTFDGMHLKAKSTQEMAAVIFKNILPFLTQTPDKLRT